VRQVGYLQEQNRDARSATHTIPFWVERDKRQVTLTTSVKEPASLDHRRPAECLVCRLQVEFVKN